MRIGDENLFEIGCRAYFYLKDEDNNNAVDK